MARRSRTVEEIAGAIAGKDHGVVTREELLAAEVSRDEIRHRLRSGALLVEYPGVYRVGHRAPSKEARYIAAVKACGQGARLSGRAAGHLLGILKGKPPPPEVITPRWHSPKGLRVRRTRAFDRRDVTIWKGIPVTSPARTIVDLAGELSEDELARAFHEATVRHHTTAAQVEEVLQRRPRSPGAAKVRRVTRGDAPVALSRLERRFRSRLEEAGLPLPVMNRRAGRKYVDCRWPEHRLTVELDSYRYHNSRYSWEQDRQREREARARGDEFRRYTPHDVFDAPESMLAELARLLFR